MAPSVRFGKPAQGGGETVSHKNYPYTEPAQRTIATKYLAQSDTKCKTCGKGFVKGERIVLQEIQNSWFRGDDDADFWHARCENPLNSKKEVQP